MTETVEGDMLQDECRTLVERATALMEELEAEHNSALVVYAYLEIIRGVAALDAAVRRYATGREGGKFLPPQEKE